MRIDGSALVRGCTRLRKAGAVPGSLRLPGNAEPRTRLPVCLPAEKTRVLYQRRRSLPRKPGSCTSCRRSLPRKTVRCTAARRWVPRKTALCTALRLGATKETAICILACCEAPRIVVLCTGSTHFATRNVDLCTRGNPPARGKAVQRSVFLGRNEKYRYSGPHSSAPNGGRRYSGRYSSARDPAPRYSTQVFSARDPAPRYSTRPFSARGPASRYSSRSFSAFAEEGTAPRVRSPALLGALARGGRYSDV